MNTAFIPRYKLTDMLRNSCHNWYMMAAPLAIGLVFATAQSLYAQTNVQCSDLSGNWCLRLSEKEDKLQFGDDPTMMMSMESDFGPTRNDYYRSMPTLELQNMGAAGAADILKFEMTIGDTRFHFDDSLIGAAAVVGNHTTDFDLTSNISPDGNLLTVTFAKQGGGGVAPGESVHFRIQLGLDEGVTGPRFYEFPDFRTVLFDKNGDQYYGPDPAFPPPAEDNAQVTVHFSNGATSGPKALLDFEVDGPQNNFVNENYHGLFDDDFVDHFGISGSGGVVPEPGTAGLALAGLFVTFGLHARQRRADSRG
jgi:hypothetical protein